MTTLRYQNELLRKRIESLESVIGEMEKLHLGRISPEIFGRVLVKLSQFVTASELASVLVGDEEKTREEK